MRRIRISPYIKICFIFALVILIGALILMLPISLNGDTISFVDAFFISTSSVCVTGLTVISDLNLKFSYFGKTVLIILIEIGGLSFITIATFFMSLVRRKMTVEKKFLLKEALNQDNLKDILKITKLIILTSLFIQFCGFILNTIALSKYYDSFGRLLFVALFHTVASFNNSGFDIFGSSSMIRFSSDIFLNVNTILLIVLGGLGFVTIYDILKKRRFRLLSLNSKIVLVTTFVLIFGGALFLKISNFKRTTLECLFMSVSCRTAGFQSIDCATLNDCEYIIMCFLMLVGASPGSTGGGIKTVTFFVIMLTIVSYSVNKSPTCFKRQISQNIIVKAFILAQTALIFCLMSSFLVLFSDKNMSFNKVFFEIVSAFSTTGLSMGITRNLNTISKYIVCFMMYFGRLGPLTIISMVNRNWYIDCKNTIRFVEEKVMIG